MNINPLTRTTLLILMALVLAPQMAKSHDGHEASQTSMPEGKLYHVVTRQLAIAKSDPSVKNVVISMPIHISDSDFHQFGDGQTNSAIAIAPYWTEDQPPVIVRQETLASGEVRYVITLADSLDEAKARIVTIDGKLRLAIDGWADSYALDFDLGVRSVDEFHSSLPSDIGLSGGRNLPDPEGIKAEMNASGKGSYETISSHSFGPGYFHPPRASHVHGIFPPDGNRRTAVGFIDSWLVLPISGHSKLKHIYVCFEGKNQEQELTYGVPSGAGWHKIGDPAETILNTLENQAILVGRASKVSNQAHGFNAVAAFGYLEPSEVFVSIQNQYHWYVIESTEPLCAEIYVHNCLPNASNWWGFQCGS